MHALSISSNNKGTDMTPPTGKRSSRACLRCRGRKTKCNLDGVGTPRKPPCESCHRSGSRCVLVQSRRGQGGAARARRQGTHLSVPSEDAAEATATPENRLSDDDALTPSDSIVEISRGTRATNGNLQMELRNPSDALQILAQTRNHFRRGHADDDGSFNTNNSDARTTPSEQLAPAPGMNTGRQASNRWEQQTSPSTVLDDYELVERGLVHASVVPELLLTYARHYHPYCPIVPSYILSPDAMTTMQRSDYFLLTVILTIASRDSQSHVLTHRYCWDHTQRLLLEVLLAHSWAQTPRTVQALLLLAEWLPYQIKQTVSDSHTPPNLASEDQTAWSLVGLAVRQGYLLRLDRAAFRSTGGSETPEREEEKRLIWAYIYLADRQISVRLGQSFWSRGPSLARPLTADDFPSLKALPGLEHDNYADITQAMVELIQILYNAHGILYSSTDRTLAMVNEGDYARYLDDFSQSAQVWHASWARLKTSHRMKTTLLMMYEYIRLYVNAFAFQAVLTRACDAAATLQSKPDQASPSRRPVAGPLSRGLMSSPDGRYIYAAIAAASNILERINSVDPQTTLRYLPTRYFVYAVYAAVFLFKAKIAGALQSPKQRRDIASSVNTFIRRMEQATSDESHICRKYSSMLKNLWSSRDGVDMSLSREEEYESHLHHPDQPSGSQEHLENLGEDTGEIAHLLPEADVVSSGIQLNPTVPWTPNGIGLRSPADTVHQLTADATQSVGDYLYGSFFPGVTNFDFPMNMEATLIPH